MEPLDLSMKTYFPELNAMYSSVDGLSCVKTTGNLQAIKQEGNQVFDYRKKNSGEYMKPMDLSIHCLGTPASSNRITHKRKCHSISNEDDTRVFKKSKTVSAVENETLQLVTLPFKRSRHDSSFIKENARLIEVKGSKKRFFQCEQCKKLFTRLHNLRMHQRAHTGELPFSCEYCHKRFSHSSNLKNHIKTHTREASYSYECSHEPLPQSAVLQRRIGKSPCRKDKRLEGFVISSDLKKHEVVHFAEKKYTCPECGATFTRRNNLNRHIKKSCKR